MGSWPLYISGLQMIEGFCPEYTLGAAMYIAPTQTSGTYLQTYKLTVPNTILDVFKRINFKKLGNILDCQEIPRPFYWLLDWEEIIRSDILEEKSSATLHWCAFKSWSAVEVRPRLAACWRPGSGKIRISFTPNWDKKTKRRRKKQKEKRQKNKKTKTDKKTCRQPESGKIRISFAHNWE